MKQILIVFLGIGLFSCSGNKSAMQEGQFTTLKIQKEFDMGSVQKGELIHTNIKIINTGDYPLFLAKVIPSCSCTVPEYDKEPIPPGDSTILEATIDTEKTGIGNISKTIEITTNTRPPKTTVTIKAIVN